VRVDQGVVRPGHVLALMEADQLPHLNGEKVQEPVYKATARWLPADKKAELSAAGVPAIEPIEVLATHMLEIIQANFSHIFTRIVMMDTLDSLVNISDSNRSATNQRILDEYIPGKVTPELLLSVLRSLLTERVAIRNLLLIVETVAEAKTMGLDLSHTIEHVRQRLSFQIVEKLLDDNGELALVQLSPMWEQKFSEHEIKGAGGDSDIALPPEEFRELVSGIQTQLNECAQKGVVASVATSSRRRRFVQTVLSSKGIRNAVLAYEEISHKSRPKIMGVV